MPTWDERFRSGEYPSDPEPSPLLRRYVTALPTGRALDLAAGTGRNAVYLAERGHEVTALDQSREGLRIARERAAERDAVDRLTPVQADAETHPLPAERYDLLTVSFYRAVDRFPDLVEALTDGGVLFYEHHLRSSDPYEAGPSGDDYRFGANELLHASLGLTVLAFDAKTEERADGRTAYRTQVVARKTAGPRQSYPAAGLDGADEATHDDCL